MLTGITRTRLSFAVLKLKVQPEPPFNKLLQFKVTVILRNIGYYRT